MKIFSLLGRGALILATACMVLACAKLTGATKQANATPAAANATANTSAPAPPPPQNAEDKMPRVKVEDAKKLVAEGKAIIIDVRGPEPYKQAHVKGALDIPLSNLEANDFKGLPKNKQIIAYCT